MALNMAQLRYKSIETGQKEYRQKIVIFQSFLNNGKGRADRAR